MVAARHHERDNDMTRTEKLTAQLSAVHDQMRGLHSAAGDRALSAAQQASWDALEAEAADIEAAITEARSAEAAEERRAAHRARWGAPSVGASDRGADIDPATVVRMDDRQAKDAALRLLDRNAGHLDDGAKAHIEKMLRAESTPDTDTGELAKHIALTSSDAYASAFRKLMAPRMSNIVTLSERESDAAAAVTRASMADGSGATGGYAVPAFLDPTIALNAQGSANPIRRLARNETITTKQWNGVGTSGITWSFVGEGAASTDASPTVDPTTVDVHTARAWITYSIELQQDAVELDRQLFRLLGNGWDESMAAALATGSGVGEPYGVVTALDAVSGSEVQILTPGTLAAVDISNVWVDLPDRARENTSWVMHESVREAIAAWGDEYGNRSVDMGGRLQNLRTRPVFSTDAMPALDTTTGSANQIVAGDFTGYLIVQRAGMTVEPVQTVVDGNGLPTGKRGLFAWARIGANVVDPGLLRLLQQ